MEINPSEYKILIVDGVMSNILLLKVLLTDEKSVIATADNEQQALEQMDKEHPGLVLLGVVIPDLSGFEVAQRLKSDPNTTDTPIIFLTTLNSTTDIVKGFQIGANDFIPKPSDKEELIIHVTHQISLMAAKCIILSKTEELQHTIAKRNKLYSVIARDLRSPMGSVKMMLNMMILDPPVEKVGNEMYELLTVANQTTEDVSSLLDNLLRQTKNRIGNLNVVYQNIDVMEVVGSAIDVLNIVTGLRKVIIREEKTEKLSISTGIDMLETVIRNLLSDAIKFSNKNSEVVMKMGEQGNMAIINIRDNDCGIDEGGQKKLLCTSMHFSTFGTNNEEGSGLGLLLCQDFVVKNGSKLWFTSKKGEGSVLCFSVPLKK